MSPHQNKKILVVCYQGQGHINPTVEFARRLAKVGVDVTFASSFAVIRGINKKTIPPNFVFVPFSDGHDDVKDPSIPMEQLVTDFLTNGAAAVEELMRSGQKFDHIVYSNVVRFTAKIADDYNINSTVLWCQPATCFDIYYYYFNDYKELILANNHDKNFIYELPGLPPLTLGDIPSFFSPSSPKEMEFWMKCLEEHYDILRTNPRVLINTFYELEVESIKSAEKIKFFPVGPLIPLEFLDENNSSNNEEEAYLNWLSEKPKQSVIYVSMGSITNLEMAQAEELAHALLETGCPFLWVIRESAQAEKLSKIEELKKQGMIVSWCSQIKVLNNQATGCFVTHCGWNSTQESLVCGVPTVGFPQWTDQLTNGKMIEDVWKVGVRVKRRENDGLVEANEIKRCIQYVMGDKEIRKNSDKWKQLAREAFSDEGSSTRNLQAFLDDL